MAGDQCANTVELHRMGPIVPAQPESIEDLSPCSTVPALISKTLLPNRLSEPRDDLAPCLRRPSAALSKNDTIRHLFHFPHVMREVYRMLRPLDCRSSFRTARILCAMSGSRLAVGSSRNRIFGSVSIALAKVSRVIWPEDSLRVTL